MRVFGYGSLIWRPGFEYVSRAEGWVEGWERRFYQGSRDHRGVPGAPGRVVTLLEREGSRVWGAVYELEDEVAREVLGALDVREQGGYERVDLEVVTRAGARVSAITYVATPANEDYLGESPMEEMAAQVVRSRGPSGENLEYVVELARALRAMGASDAHVFELERAALELAAQHTT